MADTLKMLSATVTLEFTLLVDGDEEIDVKASVVLTRPTQDLACGKQRDRILGELLLRGLQEVDLGDD